MKSMIHDSAPRNGLTFAQKLRRGATVLLVAVAVASCSRGPKEPDAPGSKPHLRLITTQQYMNTLSYVFGPSVALEVKFPPMQRNHGLLASGAAFAGVTGGQLEVFQRAASDVAGQIVNPERRDFLFPCKPADEKKSDKACATQFLSETGRLLHRRTLTDTELNNYVSQAGSAADTLKDFYAGLSAVVEAMLISPDVLFIVEKGEKDPDSEGAYRLDAYSLASRLSFFLWNASPDDELLKAAESGDIYTKKGREKIVEMMLASPRLEAGVRAFFDDMYGFDAFDSLSKDPLVYPFFTGVTVADAREQTLRTVVDHLINKNGDYRDLYTTRSTFISPALAALYKMPAKQGWTPYEFPADSPRAGVVTQVSFLASHSHPGRSSPTLRGKALRELLLCQEVPRPPPDVDFSAIENPDGHYPTQRDRVAVHLKNPSCAGCHKITDPMGLALESFDGAGRFREAEGGVKIDTTGQLDGKPFDDVVGLAQALHDAPGLPTCLVNRMYSYGAGSPARPVDRPVLEYLNTNFAGDGYKVPDLMRTIAMSKAISRVTQVKPSTEPLPEMTPAAPEPAKQQITMNQSH